MNTYVSGRRLLGVTLILSAAFATAPVLVTSAHGVAAQDPVTGNPGV